MAMPRWQVILVYSSVVLFPVLFPQLQGCGGGQVEEEEEAGNKECTAMNKKKTGKEWKDGKRLSVSWGQVVAALRHPRAHLANAKAPAPAKGAKEAFKRLDTNGNGNVDAKELEAFLTKNYIPESSYGYCNQHHLPSKKEAEKMIEVFAKDPKDGNIKINEFEGVWTAYKNWETLLEAIAKKAKKIADKEASAAEEASVAELDNIAGKAMFTVLLKDKDDEDLKGFVDEDKILACAKLNKIQKKIGTKQQATAMIDLVKTKDDDDKKIYYKPEFKDFYTAITYTDESVDEEEEEEEEEDDTGGDDPKTAKDVEEEEYALLEQPELAEPRFARNARWARGIHGTDHVLSVPIHTV